MKQYKNLIPERLHEDREHFKSQFHLLKHQCEKKLFPLVQNDFLAKIAIEESLQNIFYETIARPAHYTRPLLCYWLFRRFVLKDDFSKPIHSLNKEQSQKLNDMIHISFVVEMLHNASLIIDDIEDQSSERRGQPTAHTTHGIPLALNTGSWLYFFAIGLLPERLLPTACTLLFDCHVGQAIDISHSLPKVQKHLFESTKVERWQFYEHCAFLKTARLMQFLVNASKDILDLNQETTSLMLDIFKYFGLTFQVLDDFRNFFPDISGDKAFEDLKVGLRNAVVLTLLDHFTTHERSLAQEALHKGDFPELILNHPLLNDCLKLTLTQAEELAERTSHLLDQVALPSSEARLYMAELMERPMIELKNHDSGMTASVLKTANLKVISS